MDLISFAERFKDLISALSGLGLTSGGVIAAAAIALLYSRTSSAHPVLTLLWTRVFGKLAIHDAKIQEYVDELNNLSRFTFLTRIRPNTLHDVHNLLDWRKKWNVATEQVRACGSYFDLTLPGLKNGKPPGKPVVGATLLFAGVLTAFGAIGVAFMVPESALVTFKVSRNSLWLSESSALRFPANGKQMLEQHDCMDPPGDLSQRTGFPEGEVKMLCSFFSGGDVNPAEYVERNVQQNRLAFGVVALLLLSFALPFWADGRRGQAANLLAYHLQEHEDRLKITFAKAAIPGDGQSNIEVAEVRGDPGATNRQAISEPDAGQKVSHQPE